MNHAADELNDHLLARALRLSSTPTFFVDKSGIIRFCNDAYAEMLGRSVQSLMKTRAPSLLPSPAKAKFFLHLWQTLAAGKTWIGELEERKDDGTIINVETVFTPVADAHGRPTLFMAIAHDITGKKIEYERLSHQANHDKVTELPNRTFFISMSEHIFAQAQRNERKVAMLFIDLDGFKGVNDTLGHDAGDQVLVSTAHALQSTLRKSDVVARFGGDEFVCLLDDVDSTDSAMRMAQKMLESIEAIKSVDAGRVNISASIGVAVFPDHGATEEAIRAAADSAMYSAKRSGKRCIHLYKNP